MIEQAENTGKQPLNLLSRSKLRVYLLYTLVKYR